MRQFEVNVKMIVNASDDFEAFIVAQTMAEHMVCGQVVEVKMGSVTETAKEIEDECQATSN